MLQTDQWRNKSQVRKIIKSRILRRVWATRTPWEMTSKKTSVQYHRIESWEEKASARSQYQRRLLQSQKQRSRSAQCNTRTQRQTTTRIMMLSNRHEPQLKNKQRANIVNHQPALHFREKPSRSLESKWRKTYFRTAAAMKTTGIRSREGQPKAKVKWFLEYSWLRNRCTAYWANTVKVPHRQRALAKAKYKNSSLNTSTCATS